MNILILNGSARKNGTVATLLKCVAEGIVANGHEAEWIAVSALKVQPCMACMQGHKWACTLQLPEY